MPESEEKVVSMTTSVAEPEKTRKRRVRRSTTQRSVDKTDIKGEAIVKTEEVIITQKAHEKPKGIKVETQQAFKLVPKKVAAAPTPAPAPALLPLAKAKITILPKTKKVQKITIIGKPIKKAPVSLPAPTMAIKQKISLPASKKTRKQYKERRLRIEL